MSLAGNWDRQSGSFLFHCPGCGFAHVVTITRSSPGPVWSWDGNRERPTFSPSLLVTIPPFESYPGVRCHSFIRSGRIEFLSDCHHQLAGKTVDLPPWDTADVDSPPPA